MNIKNFAIESAIIVDVHEEPDNEFVLGTSSNKQALDSDKSCGNGTDDSHEEMCYVLKYKVFCSGLEQFHYANIGKFIEEYYHPKAKSERMSSGFLEEINQRLTDIKLDVVTQDFDESGAVSVYATFLPIGFDSWDDYLKSLFNRYLPMRRCVAELSGMVFHIPFQQRGYKWTSNNVRELIADFWEFINSEKKVYCLQPLAVVEKEKGKVYSVLDGQQRLTTLFLLYKYLSGGENAYNFLFDRDEESGENRWDFLSMLPNHRNPDSIDQNIDLYFIDNAYKTIIECFSISDSDKDNKIFELNDEASLYEVKERFLNLLTATKESPKSVQVIWYEVEKESAYDVFRNLNSGKIALTNTELIKALLLNRVSGLEREQLQETASQFETIERSLQDDHFWYMIRSEEVKKGQTRMDLLFNLVANVSDEEYGKDPRTSFRWFANEDNGTLSEKWEKVRHTYLRLKDMYQDIKAYHYIGFLTYENKQRNKSFIPELLKSHRKLSKSKFVDELRKKIRNAIMFDNGHQHLEDFVYERKMVPKLRLLFLLHNIETILQRYDYLRKSSELQLQHEYEWFPFELLHKQSWDIEHIASQTDSKFKSKQDRDDWLASIHVDYPDYFIISDSDSEDDKKDKAVIIELEKVYLRKDVEENFMHLYNAVITYNDRKTEGAINDEDKNQIGNLVLLDSHTNRSFHNSLFPRKRRIVIIADGLKSEDDIEHGIRQVFIPACTRQCFTKSYHKGSNTKLNTWRQEDADYYTKDIEEKLCDTSIDIQDGFLLPSQSPQEIK